jgi:putative toxin-antitoxin system antitoxin component (TIGR02293 family)
MEANMATTFSLAFEDRSSPQRAFLAKLGALLGLASPLQSEEELAHSIPLRIDIAVLDNLLQEGLSNKELTMVLPLRTLSHRRARQQPLSPDESDRALRIARLVALSEVVFGSREKALHWLRKPLRRFNNRSAMAMMATEIGGRQVEELLIQIDEGYGA